MILARCARVDQYEACMLANRSCQSILIGDWLEVDDAWELKLRRLDSILQIVEMDGEVTSCEVTDDVIEAALEYLAVEQGWAQLVIPPDESGQPGDGEMTYDTALNNIDAAILAVWGDRTSAAASLRGQLNFRGLVRTVRLQAA